jgi:hypothetical protein
LSVRRGGGVSRQRSQRSGYEVMGVWYQRAGQA